MKPIVATLPRFASMHAWANRILRVDLSDMSVCAQEAGLLIPDYLGARGFAARLCWNECPAPVEPLSPANPLMVMTGALTGSRAPYAGRTNVCAFSPQAFPHPWFTRSSIGGRLGGELKRAGYDGIVITGAADEPVHLVIRDDEARVVPAHDLLRLDALDALAALQAEGRGAQSLTIGPAGRHRSRLATIMTDSSSACGQGGFGAVMGSKNLIAITALGSGRVSLASPEAVSAMARALRHVARPPSWFGEMGGFNDRLAAAGHGQARLRPCTEGCVTPCAVAFRNVPGATCDRRWAGDWVCIGVQFRGGFQRAPADVREAFDWDLDMPAAFEMNILSNRYGLNQFDILCGLVPWLILCQKAGLISEVNGMAMDWRSPTFWATFLQAIAYREGLGDVLAEGGWAAAQALGMGVDLAARLYAGWGQANHWDGHNIWNHPFPYWIPTLLQWLADTRDPISGDHGALRGLQIARGMWQTEDETARHAIHADLRAFGQRIYGDPDAADPYAGYAGKAAVGHYHTLRPIIKDCVPVDDQVFPLLWARDTPDHVPVLRDIPGVGDIAGPSVEYALFRAGTGSDWDEPAFTRAAQRIVALERALQVRHWARDRAMDESILPYFQQSESHANPLLGEERLGLDRAQFAPVLDAFYRLQGWDVTTGWPTGETLEALGLGEVHDPMIAGATRAQEA